ncbi:hypothetical protein PAXRUDRAFT_37048 [Paxillus rubicundulus Ve08.2h10]|uniref:Uncharacterized protein n=1 Tax=Paxillus rubicundulus Ve08.2h10 TaxID=930991 RepID=A0A0D0CT49_9AGAM|nr:hypothetical protein PAXRUDRAFT_37048 [Paxillus rubicundulus Ve08.2h10]
MRCDGKPVLDKQNKTGCGFYHDATGRLLCPVDYDWNNTHLVYMKEKYDPENPSKGLFKNDLLVKTFKYIFTSPSSTDTPDHDDDDTVGQARKRHKKVSERHTCSHVASLLGMKAVGPRTIAYVAVQLHFALSSCGSWRIVDEDFDYEQFYNNIIMFFEGAETPEEKDEIKDLLLWWNR